MVSDLLELGLSQEEAKAYLSILELGGSYASNIARKAGINRATCYHTLNNLVKKGLVNSHRKQRVLWFNVDDPSMIIDVEKRKLERARNLVPQLLSISNTITFKPKIRFYEGVEGVKNIFEDLLQTKDKEVLGYTNIGALGKLLPGYFEDFCQRKIEKGLKTRYLSPNTGVGVDIIDTYYPPNYDRNLVEILLVNKEEFFFENEISIYENKVAIFSLTEEEVTGILIESSTFAKSMRSIFNLAWLGATAFVAR
jgi:HTH-type transcriptional regulator, sugar sensing transcriptional regulator